MWPNLKDQRTQDELRFPWKDYSVIYTLRTVKSGLISEGGLLAKVLSCKEKMVLQVKVVFEGRGLQSQVL